MDRIGADEPVAQSVLAASRDSVLAGKKAMRDLIAEALDDGVAPRDLASLTRRLSDLIDEIEQIEAVAGKEAMPSGGRKSSRKFDAQAI